MEKKTNAIRETIASKSGVVVHAYQADDFSRAAEYISKVARYRDVNLTPINSAYTALIDAITGVGLQTPDFENNVHTYADDETYLFVRSTQTLHRLYDRVTTMAYQLQTTLTSVGIENPDIRAEFVAIASKKFDRSFDTWVMISERLNAVFASVKHSPSQASISNDSLLRVEREVYVYMMAQTALNATDKDYEADLKSLMNFSCIHLNADKGGYAQVIGRGQSKTGLVDAITSDVSLRISDAKLGKVNCDGLISGFGAVRAEELSITCDKPLIKIDEHCISDPHLSSRLATGSSVDDTKLTDTTGEVRQTRKKEIKDTLDVLSAAMYTNEHKLSTAAALLTKLYDSY